MLLAAFPASVEFELRAVICFKTPKGSVHKTTSPKKTKKDKKKNKKKNKKLIGFLSTPF